MVLLIMIAGGFMVGMNATLNVSGSDKNIMLLGAGSLESVERSEVKMESSGIVSSSIKGYKIKAGVEGVSPEVHIQMPIEIQGEDRLVLIRGVESEAFLVHDRVDVEYGSLPRAGHNELIVGSLATRTLGYRLPDDALGQKILLDNYF